MLGDKSSQWLFAVMGLKIQIHQLIFLKRKDQLGKSSSGCWSKLPDP
jgi:hypothetical protein